MLLVIVDDKDQPIGVASDYSSIGPSTKYKGPRSWNSFTEADMACRALNALNLPDGPFHATYDTRGRNKGGDGHIFNVQVNRIPKIGDEVSSTCNGDFYPEGRIVKISSGHLKIIVTDSGAKFTRKGYSDRWIKGGCWAMVDGHREDRNPHV